MGELILHTLPVVFAIASFWSNTERKLLLLNLGLCVSIASLLLLQQAWGGALVITVAGLSTTYRLVTQRLLGKAATYVTIVIMSSLVGVINNLTGQTGILELMPVMTFIFYRYGELHCREAGLRLCMVIGSGLFTVYGVLTETWGLALTELLFAFSNSWFYLRLRRNAAQSAA
ncbi:YgjV family protein [Alteromonas halophila]|uniref:Formyltetrahydrofolate deformylase n=1 Tax=Alteromonas halophila TaxID=516698 RepID=A0A918JG75_9ALTE|nr:YgjV family protein [Alteromonas halophila]GGW78483.1 hypothetical protein GCM10007391_08860 [Alteromonas halophila]